MKVSVITFGCKVNQYESQAMLGSLTAAGFTACDTARESDVVLINTCTVTAMSDRKARQALRRARRENPNAIIVLTGCMPQAFPKIADELSEADVVLGNSNRSSLLEDILRFLSSRQRVVDIVPHRGGAKFEPMRVENFYERTRAFLKIEDGCNRFCSYCIIPYARGRVRSKPIEDVKREIAALAGNGYREIVLTGINLSAYGQELGLTLCDAVEAACEPESVSRVRLGSLEPERLDDETVARLKRQDKLCPQFHLSLQSGCDATLRRMNRHYDTAEYRRIVDSLRACFPNAAITTDVMVGFPGETEEEFEQSLAFVKEIGFAKAHVFEYSRRLGTEADRMPDQVPAPEKERRSRRMLKQAEASRRSFFESQVGLLEPVLFERQCGENVYEGYTANYTPVRVNSRQELSGSIVSVRITGVKGDSCTGEPALSV